MEQLGQLDAAGGHRSLKAVMVGPFQLYELPRLEREIAHNHKIKETLHVQPDAFFIKKTGVYGICHV